MKACACCGTVNPAGVATCVACGEASWSELGSPVGDAESPAEIEPVAVNGDDGGTFESPTLDIEAAPDETPNEPDTAPIVQPSHDKRRGSSRRGR